MVSEKTSFSDAQRRRTTDARATTASLLTQSGKFVDNLHGVSEKTRLTEGWTPVTPALPLLAQSSRANNICKTSIVKVYYVQYSMLY